MNFLADITGTPTTKHEHFYYFQNSNQHTKVDVQIVQCAHGVCALQSSSSILVITNILADKLAKFYWGVRLAKNK